MAKTTKVFKPVPLGERIEQAAWAALDGKVSGITRAYNFCLQFARRVVEEAMGLNNRGFYRLVQGVDSNPSAKELEALLRQQKPSWVVSGSVKAGDLVFWRDLPPQWGHVGVIVRNKSGFCVAQNTTIENRGQDYGGAFQLVPLNQMAKPTTIIRIGG